MRQIHHHCFCNLVIAPLEVHRCASQASSLLLLWHAMTKPPSYHPLLSFPCHNYLWKFHKNTSKVHILRCNSVASVSQNLNEKSAKERSSGNITRSPAQIISQLTPAPEPHTTTASISISACVAWLNLPPQKHHAF